MSRQVAMQIVKGNADRTVAAAAQFGRWQCTALDFAAHKVGADSKHGCGGGNVEVLLSRLDRFTVHSKSRSLATLIHQARSCLPWPGVHYDNTCCKRAASVLQVFCTFYGLRRAVRELPAGIVKGVEPGHRR